MTTACEPKLPRSRSQLIVSPLGHRGQHVVKDPVGLSYYEVGPEEAFLLRRLDGSTTATQISEEFDRAFGRRLDPTELEEFLELARESFFLEQELDSSAQTTTESRSKPQPRQIPSSDRINQNILYWRLRLLDPDRLLEWMEPRLRFLWTRAFLILSSCAIALAVLTVIAQRDAAAGQFQQTLHWQTLALGWVVLLVVNLAHEFAHGLTCKHWGGRVREIGFYLIFFIPAFYCNVSDAWMFRQRRQRMWVTLAGGWCDLCVWSMAVFAWRLSMPETVLNYIAWIVMLATGVSSLFNLNPLLKLDGYYLLSDALEIPNLRQRAWTRWLATVRWALWGADEPKREPHGRLLVLFGLACWVYSVGFLLVLVGWATWSVGMNLGKPAALVAATFGLFVIAGQFRGICGGEVRNMMKTRRARVWAWVAASVVVLAALLWLPVPDRASGAFELRAVRRAEVRAPVAGFLKSVSCSEGEHIDAGQQVALLDVPELASKLAKVRAEMDQSRARIRMTHLGSHRVPVASVTEEADLREAEVTAEEAVLAGLAHEQEFLTQRQARLRVTTPVAGSVSTPRLAQQVGRYFSEGELICVVEDVSDVEAEIEIPEQSIRWVRVGQSVTLRPRATPMKAVEATVTRIAPSATTQPTQSAVHVYCELTDPELLPGMTGYARIHCPKRPAGRVLLESLLRILRTEYWW